VKITATILFFLSVVCVNAADLAKVSFEKDILPILEEHCFSCHGDGEAKGDLSLDGFKTANDVHRGYKIWEKIRKLVLANEMPPQKKKKRPDAKQRALLTDWTRQTLDTFYRTAPPDPGRVTVRRLNRAEYNNTIRDLMRVDFKPARDFPADDSGYGFDNIGDVLTMSPLLMEKYFAAAERIAAKAVAVPNADGRIVATPFQKFYFRYPVLPKLRRNAAEGFFRTFLTRAYRRPVRADEVRRLMLLAKQVVDDGASFEHGIRMAVVATLVSPHFLFRWEFDGAPKNPKAIRSLNEHELASRLSFFIWNSIPDDTLMELARRGQLRKNLPAQIRRMLRDAKAQSLVANFTGQWLQLRNLEMHQPDKRLFSAFNNELRADMRRETEMLFAHVMRENRSVVDLLDADYTFVNDRLANWYGLKNVKGGQFRIVSLKGTPRGGVLTHASVLTLTSDPNRTSPVKRGKYVLENILGTPPPPAPDNVPELESDAELKGTLRQQMVKHRENPVCASCHQKMDPIGFAFENFDAVGRWRTLDNGESINAASQLDSGEKFRDATGLRKILAVRKRDLFVRCLTEKMLTFALGRGLEFYDKRAVDGIVKQMERDGFKFETLVMGIVKSLPFDMKRGEEGGK
jgi:mono/diheme cytochrome c family protein